MKFTEEHIDQLFSNVRHSSPVVSFESVEENFYASLERGTGRNGKMNWDKILTFKNVLIMLGIITSILIAVNFISTSNPVQSKNNSSIQAVTPIIRNINSSGKKLKNERVEQNSINNTLTNSNQSQTDNTFKSGSLPIYKTKTSTAPSSNNYVNNYFNYWGKSNGADDEQFIFEITNKTTKEELELIKQLATKSKVNFNYQTRKIRGTVKSIELELIHPGQPSSINYGLSRKFSIIIGWKVNKDGAAIQLYQDPLMELHDDLVYKTDDIFHDFDQKIKDLEIRFNQERRDLTKKIDQMNNDLSKSIIEGQLDSLFLAYENNRITLENNFQDKMEAIEKKIRSTFKQQQEEWSISADRIDDFIDNNNSLFDYEFKIKQTRYHNNDQWIEFTNNSTKEELEVIKKRVEKAGMEFSYNIKYSTYEMYLPTESMYRTEMKGSSQDWTIRWGWLEDENGKAIILLQAGLIDDQSLISKPLTLISPKIDMDNPIQSPYQSIKDSTKTVTFSISNITTKFEMKELEQTISQYCGQLHYKFPLLSKDLCCFTIMRDNDCLIRYRVPCTETWGVEFGLVLNDQGEIIGVTSNQPKRVCK